MTNELWHGDNLDILRGMESGSIDLIYLDPPYNSKRDYNVTFGGMAQAKAFEDTWTWGRDDERILRGLDDRHPAVYRLLEALGAVLSKRGLYPYLVNMAARLVELHRLLKPTGSIYLHVDPTASHYLKLVMDQVFGGQNFRNEIIWFYNTQGKPKKGFAKKHDTLLCYSKSDDWTSNKITIQPNDVARYNRVDENGRRYQIDGKGYTYYLDDGRHCPDVWDMPALTNNAKERLGYPTQKPLALLERIIQASSNEGDVVLDPYMGSGTTIVAAAKHGRKWIGIDVTHLSVATVSTRLGEYGIELGDEQKHGVPADLAGARALKQENPREFDAWCALTCKAAPHDVNGRIVGLRQFPSIKDGKEHLRRALYMPTTEDPPTMEDLTTAIGQMRKHGCELGFLYCFEMPTDPAVLHFLQNQSQFTDDLRSMPTLQLITMRDMIHGNSAADLTSAWRQRRLRDLTQQMELV